MMNENKLFSETDTSRSGPANGLDRLAVLLDRIIDPVSRSLSYIGAAILMVMAFGILVDIVSRSVFNYPLLGMIELETFMLVLLGFFSLAYTMIKDGHVSVDILSSKFSEKVTAVLNISFSLWALFLFSIMSWQSVLRAGEAIESNELASITGIPFFPFYFVAAFGCALISVVFLKNFIRGMAGIIKLFPGKAFPVLFTVVLLAGLTIAFFPGLKMLEVEMSNTTVGVVVIVMLLTMMFMGFPVAFAMALTGFLGLWYMIDADVALNIMRMSTYDSVAHYYFCIVPFFILMGFLCLRSGVGARLFSVGSKWFGRFPGGLAIGTIFGCGGFAAICGDSLATAATMGSVALPEMKKYNYDGGISAGSVAAGGTLGILIPPSIGFIVYAIITEQSVGKLFIAGIVPGILLTVLFGLLVYIQCRIKPELGPPSPKIPFMQMLFSLKEIWPVTVLFIVVIGGIYSGFMTPTESGGIGVVGALIIAVFLEKISGKDFVDAVLTSTQMTAMIFAIIIGVSVLGYFITLTNIPGNIASFIGGLPVSKYVIFVMILLLYLFLGMLMNIIPMMMLTLPLLYPTILAIGFDPIWFGVIMVIMMEMGQISPPIGINVFVIHGVARDISMGKIFRGVMPFILVEVLVIFILTIFPDIVMWLPDAMDVLAPLE